MISFLSCAVAVLMAGIVALFVLWRNRVAACVELLCRNERITAESDRQKEELVTLKMEVVRSRSQLESVRQAQEEQTQRQLQEVKELRDAFRGLSAEALQQAMPEFLKRAQEVFVHQQEVAKGDLDHRQQVISEMLKPLAEQVKQYQEQTRVSEGEQNKMLAVVKERLENLTQTSTALTQTTAEFSRVLQSNTARGSWGEVTLRRIVEVAGMSPWCDFAVQVSGEEGTRPDMVVTLPDNHSVIIDAKAPDLSPLKEADRLMGAERLKKLSEYAAAVRRTISALAKRNYPQDQEFAGALDYTVMFLPAESMLACALEADSEILLWAAQQRVMIATPASLIALLGSTRLCWRQFERQKNVEEIAHTAQELYERLCIFAEHFEDIQSNLQRTNTAYNKAVSSFTSRILPTGRRLQELGISPNKRLPAIEEVR